MIQVPRPSRCMAMICLACIIMMPACVWRTEHTAKVETVHKIEAHIVLDVRKQIEAHEDYIRADDESYPEEDEPTSFTWNEDHEKMMAGPRWWSWLAVLDPAVRCAAADGARVTRDAFKAAIQTRQSRNRKVNEALKEGSVGENNRGYLEVRLKKNADREEMETAQALVNGENQDRKTMFRWIDQESEQEESILSVIEEDRAAVVREKHLKAGMWFQTPEDKELFKIFKKSGLGREYMGIKPGEWVQRVRISTDK
jgi:uncharacterized protein YdbL (DUF1318 family)